MAYQQPYNPYQQPFNYGMPGMTYASAGKRFVAHLLDSIIISLGMIPGFCLIMFSAFFMASSADSRGRVDDATAGVALIFIVLGYALLFAGMLAVGLYEVYLLGRDGATLGKRWMRIRVLDQLNRPLGFGKAFLRELVKYALGNVCFILLLWPLWDEQKQGLQDKIFNTHVYEY